MLWLKIDFFKARNKYENFCTMNQKSRSSILFMATFYSMCSEIIAEVKNNPHSMINDGEDYI